MLVHYLEVVSTIKDILLSKSARIDVVDILETIHVLQKMLLPKSEMLLSYRWLQPTVALEIIRIQILLPILQKVTP